MHAKPSHAKIILKNPKVKRSIVNIYKLLRHDFFMLISPP